MDDDKVTIRMGTEEIQIMEAYLLDHPELGSRSNFVRTAVREYINRDADRTPADKNKDGIFIGLKEFERNTIRMVIEKDIFMNEEEFIRACVRDTVKEKYRDDLKTAQSAANIPL